jgi:hypothetical protein
MDAGLKAKEDAKAIFEPDQGTLVETKEVADQIAETALAERPSEPVGDTESAAMTGHS